MSDGSTFRSVLRGYDPAQVDQAHGELSQALEQARKEAADRTVELSQIQKSNQRLQEQVDHHASTIAGMQEEQRSAAAPTFADLGARIGKILILADEEAAEIRGSATEQVEQLKSTVEQETGAARALADRYASEARSKADAEASQILEKAKREADQIIDDADRQSSARREEGEAFYENQRAKAAAAAADFESTLGSRRDKAAADFSSQMATYEQSLAETQDRSAQLNAESDKAHAEAMAEIAAARERAQHEADSLLSSAREKAERIRRDSERELSAATARRDSITAQLSNVRQMLSTLGGAAMVETLDAVAAPPAAAEEPVVDPADAEGDQVVDAEVVDAQVDGKVDASEQGEHDAPTGVDDTADEDDTAESAETVAAR